MVDAVDIKLNYTAFKAVLRRDYWVFRKDIKGNSVRIILQPFFFLVTFGFILPKIRILPLEYADILLPGVIAISAMNAGIFSVAGPIVLSFDHKAEIMDHILSPISIFTLAAEKIIFGALQGLLSGTLIFLIGLLLLGSEASIDLSRPWLVLVIVALTGMAFASMGLILGTSIHRPPIMWETMFFILTPMMFFGGTFFPIKALNVLHPRLELLALIMPTTYASEGIRGVLTPHVEHLNPALAFAGLAFWVVILFALGLKSFERRAID
ncbi:MAG: ABC transporter permease [Candidatus Hydrothermarchaeales archaeon]